MLLNVNAVLGFQINFVKRYLRCNYHDNDIVGVVKCILKENQKLSLYHWYSLVMGWWYQEPSHHQMPPSEGKLGYIVPLKTVYWNLK